MLNLKKVWICLFVLSIMFVSGYVNAQAPDWSWSQKLGDNPINIDINWSVIDSQGNVYVVWSFWANDLGLESNWMWDVFVVKLNPSWEIINTFKRWDVNDQNVMTLKLDNNDNIYVLWSDSNGNFILQLDSWLNQSYSPVYFSGWASVMDIDDDGYLYVIWGYDTTIDLWNYQLINNDWSSYWFVAKISSWQWWWEWQWAKSISGLSVSTIWIKTDNQWNSYFVGTFAWDTWFGSNRLEDETGNTNWFVAKISSLWEWQWAKKYATNIESSSVLFNTATFDDNGNIYVVGQTNSYQILVWTGLGDNDFPDWAQFILKLDSWWNYQSIYTGDGLAYYQVYPDNDGNLYVVWWYKDSISFGDLDLIFSNVSTERDTFIAKLSSWWQWEWLKWLWGTGNDNPSYVTIDDLWNPYIIWSYLYGISIDENDWWWHESNRNYFIAKLSVNERASAISTLGTYVWNIRFDLWKNYLQDYLSARKDTISLWQVYTGAMYYYNDTDQSFDGYIVLPWWLRYKPSEVISPSTWKTLNFKVKFFEK